MNNIFVTIGLPCSGKSKYCYDNAKNTTQVIQNVNDINIFYKQDENGDAIKNFLQNDIYVDMDNYSGNEIEYKLIKLFRLSIFNNHKFDLHIVRFKRDTEQSLYNLKFSTIPEYERYEIEEIIIRKEIPTIHIGKLLELDCIETVDVIEMETFACPYYYRELNNGLKLHVFGNKFVTTKWKTNLKLKCFDDNGEEIWIATEDENEDDFSKLFDLISIFSKSIKIGDDNFKRIKMMGKKFSQHFYDYYEEGDSNWIEFDLSEIFKYLKYKNLM